MKDYSIYLLIAENLTDFKDTASLSSGYATPIIPQEHMENKINALEDELSALRQQIAQLIAVQRPDTCLFLMYIIIH